MSTTEHKHSSRGDARQAAHRPPLSPDALVSTSSQSSLQWVPPKNCARIAGIEANAHRFFPLELTSCDYVTRVFRIVASALSMLCEIKESIAPSIQQGSTESNKSTVGASSLLSSFLRICEIYSRVVEDNRKSACELLMRVPDQTTPLMQSLVGIYQSEVSMATSRVLSLDQGRLTDLSELFRASKSLINCLLVEPAEDRPQPPQRGNSRLISEGKVHVVGDGRASYLLAELQRLEEQHFSHASFKERRMAMLGWAWQEAEVSASMRVGAASEIGMRGAGPSPSQLLRDASELQAQLQDLVKPSCQANILLLYRLIYIAQDLDALMRTLAEDGEYSEAQRIRDLKTAIDRTVSSQGRSFLDLVEQSCVQAQVLAAELRSCVEAATATQKRSENENSNPYSELLDCEDMIEQLLSLRLLLHSLGAPFSLLSQPEYVELLAAQGSKVVDADFVFTAPHGLPSPPDHHRHHHSHHHRSDSASIVTIGSLIIAAGSYSILNAVLSSWPNFSSLKARETLSNAHSFEDAAVSNHQLVDCLTSPILRSVDDKALPTYPSPVSDSSYTHPHSASGIDDSGLELRFSPQPYSQLDRTAATFFAQRFNDVGFSPAILNVLISFEELQLQLKELLELPSAALNELLLRFVGISSDLLQLSDMNISIGNLPESDRLLMLRDAVDSTIDADLQDLDEESARSICGRGRSRLSDLDTLVRQVKVGRKELQRVAVRARLEKDFTGAQALDSVAADLSKSLFRLQQSMMPFSLLSVEDDLNISDAGLEINDRIARDGSSFITADFLFNFSNSSRHSIASLAVIAGAGAILRHIRKSWPGLTALKARGGSHNGLTLTGEGAWDQLTGEGQQGSVGSGTIDRIDFRDANSMRLLGFDAHALRLAGFSDIDVLTAGYTASELRDASFTAEELREVGLAESTLRVVGFQLEQQMDALSALFQSTRGDRWKDCSGWRAYLQQPPHRVAAADTDKRSSASPCGLAMDRSTKEVVKIQLCANNLSGPLSDSIGCITSLVQLNLSSNNLVGPLPAALGLLHHLESLCLDRNQLRGEIPRSLKNLQRLLILKLEFNELTGPIPAAIGGLSKLRRLDLSHNLLEGSIPAKLTQLQELQELILCENRLSGPIPVDIGNLRKLCTLQLHSNQLQGPIPQTITKLTLLTVLTLQGNTGVDGISKKLYLQQALKKCKIKL